MGQRSQIYVRADGKLVLARYYQWNYGERMISRARYGIEYMKYYVDEEYNWIFKSSVDLKKIARYLDVNFDMKDIVISSDILKEYEEYGLGSMEHVDNHEDDKGYSVYDFVFAGQDNNDGQLLIDIDTVKKSIKYGFFDGCGNYEEVMTADGYMEWDRGNESEVCEDNIKAIREMAELMTPEEANEFVHTEEYFDQPMPF